MKFPQKKYYYEIFTVTIDKYYKELQVHIIELTESKWML